MASRNKIQMEYIINSSVGVLYNCLSNPSGLESWFADKVNIRDNMYTFEWDGSEDTAELLSKRDGEFVKFRWDWADKDEYFELRIKIDDITSDVALIITDFAEDGEEEETRLLWDSQISDLMHNLGS